MTGAAGRDGDDLAQVRRYMTKAPLWARPSDDVSVVQAVLAEAHVSSLPVIEEGRLVGVVSRTDLLRVSSGRRAEGIGPSATPPRLRIVRGDLDRNRPLVVLPRLPVRDIMTPNPVTVRPEDSIRWAARSMSEGRIHRVYVVDGTDQSRVVGVLSVVDVMAAVADRGGDAPLSTLMSSPVRTISVADSALAGIHAMAESHLSALIVVDDNGWPVGAFSQVEALEARTASSLACVADVMDPAVIFLPTSAKIHRAAAHAVRMGVRRVVAVADSRMEGIVSALDFARYAQS